MTPSSFFDWETFRRNSIQRSFSFYRPSPLNAVSITTMGVVCHNGGWQYWAGVSSQKERPSPSICLNCCFSGVDSPELVRETERLSNQPAGSRVPDPTLTSNDAQLTYPPCQFAMPALSLSLSVCLPNFLSFFCPLDPLLPSRIWHSLTLELTSIYPDPDRSVGSLLPLSVSELFCSRGNKLKRRLGSGLAPPPCCRRSRAVINH